MCKVEKDRWPAYAERFDALRAGRRFVRVNPSGPGVKRWLKSAVLRHMHEEMARERSTRPLPTIVAGRTSGDVAGFMSRKEGSDSPARYPSAQVRDARGTPRAPVTDAARPDLGASSIAARRVS